MQWREDERDWAGGKGPQCSALEREVGVGAKQVQGFPV